MKFGTYVTVATAFVVTSALGAEPQPLETRITAVTVYSDRAQVTRTATVELGAQPTRFSVPRLPGWIDPESVRVALEPQSAGQVLDVTVETAYLSEASEEAVRKAQAAAREVADELAAVTDEEHTLGEEVLRLEALRALSLDKVPRELAVGDLKVKSLGETMAYITETVRGDRKLLRGLAAKRRDLEPVLAQRQRELADVQAGSQLQQSTVLVELKGSARAQIHITYLTPGASWEPLGEVRVSRNGTAVSVLQSASVSQTTGEDWVAAKLSFSTQNPNDTLDVPRVHGLLLDKGGAALGSVVGPAGGSFLRAQAIYASSNERVAKNKDHWRDSLQFQTEVQSRAVEHFNKMSGRGTTAHFAALSDERTVRADGKPVRVAIASNDFTAVTRVVAAPEVSLNAVRVADLTNGGSTPILPGRAMLFEDGAFVGRNELEFVAAGEKFSLFLGVQDRVKLERTLDRKSSSLHTHGKRTEMALSFVITAENLGSTPISIELSERVPVAQTEEIEVNDVELPNKAKADAQGLVKWTQLIPPRTKLTWRTSYTLEYPTDFVARTRAAAAVSGEEPPSPAAAQPTKRSLSEQIDKFEMEMK